MIFRKGGEEMSGSLDIFMLVVEEMSFTKAARRAFLTQQCVSDHIRRLERDYDTVLFERKPKLALTPAGEMMYRSMLQIRNMQSGMENRIREITKGAMGELTVGINSSRARVLMPGLFLKYHQAYPNVTVSVFSDDTPNMAQMLIKGKIDLFMAADVASNPLFKVLPLTRDSVYLIASDKLLQAYFPDAFPQCKEEFRRGANLALFEGIPFVRNYQTSTINHLIDNHINSFNFNLRQIFTISDYDIQLRLCASHQVAAFAPTMVLRSIIQFNRQRSEEDRVNIFPIKDMNQTLRIDCVHLKSGYLPQYAFDFIRFVEEEIEAEKSWLLENGVRFSEKP